MSFDEKFALAVTLASGRLAASGTSMLEAKDVAYVLKYCFEGLEKAEEDLRGSGGTPYVIG
jgi:hypothetical protein